VVRFAPESRCTVPASDGEALLHRDEFGASLLGHTRFHRLPTIKVT
jgi:hypothetical protein